MDVFDRSKFELGYENRFQRFQDLMRDRVREVLLVASLYDSFILSEDGRLHEELLNQYLGLNLATTPGITRVSNEAEALRLGQNLKRFDLIIVTLGARDRSILDFAKKVRKQSPRVPIVPLAYDTRQLAALRGKHDLSAVEKAFVWQGDFRILLAIIKYIEDRNNVARDSQLVEVQSIILIEDSVRFYSSYLPLIYTELVRHTQSLISEGVNPAHMLLRMRARPKILLCNSYEEAWDYYQNHHDTILGVISDIQFPRKGQSDPQAGFEFARNVGESHADIPILLQSRDPENREIAEGLGASFLLKDSPLLLKELREFMQRNFSFGDFIFRLPDGSQVGQANDLKSLEEQIRTVPDASLLHHGKRNHFSNWLKARTEFWLADKLRPQKVTDYGTVDQLRQYLIECLHALRVERHRGIVVEYDRETFVEASSVARIGGGSLGGKARGLGFGNILIGAHELQNRFEGVRISTPPTLVLATEVFERFLDQNQLRDSALSSNQNIREEFLKARLPEDAIGSLQDFLESVRFPLSVRSSSLLEDSQHTPFAGVYNTYMIPNSHPETEVRLKQLLTAIKRVYASTFSSSAKQYVKSTPYRLEEERMAVIVQELVGNRHEDRFYPDFSGVARSFNFYPVSPMKASDGIAEVALGLGKTVVEGEQSLRFSPKYPRHLVQFSSVENTLKDSQREFWALELPANGESTPETEFELSRFGIETAHRDGVLNLLGSTYSHENHAIYDGVSRPGTRLVTFAPILKGKLFPLADILSSLLELTQGAMGGPVEVEFAGNLSVPPGQPKEFYLLQMRPMVADLETDLVGLADAERGKVICQSPRVLGHGLIRDIRDLVVLDPARFNREHSAEAARDVARYNRELTSINAPYLLIGMGRWGSSDPWLGIPVKWEDIWGARVIVESGLADLDVAPSQGTHFFQNITTDGVGYFTIGSKANQGEINWDWLSQQPALSETKYVRHLRLDDPLTIVMDGRTQEGAILSSDQPLKNINSAV